MNTKHTGLACIAALGIGLSAEAREFLFEYSVEFDSPSATQTEAWIPVPQDTDVQQILDLQVQSDAEYQTLQEANYGNKYLYFPKVLAGDKVKLQIHVNRQERAAVPAKAPSNTRHQHANRLVPVGGKFEELVQQKGYTPDNIRQVYDGILKEMYYGKPIVADKSDKYFDELPQLIRDGVTREDVVNLHTQGGDYTYGMGNSLYACDIGVGNCTDYHSYFLSILRTMGLSARFHIGFSLADTPAGTLGGYHCWADWYDRDKGWVPVDISEADKNPAKADFFFGHLDDNRITFTTGRDLLLQGWDNAPINFFVYPHMEVDNNQSFAYTTQFSYRNVGP